MQRGSYFSINHKQLFLFGYLFYFFTPYIVGTSNLFNGFPGMELYQGFFSMIPKRKIDLYMLITLSWLPAFYLGHACFSLFKPYKLSLQQFPASPLTRSVSYAAILLFLVLIYFTFVSRGSIFGGYSSYDVNARGKMSTLLVIYNFFLVYQLITRQKVSKLLILGTVLTALFLLSMGGRMYVLQTLIIILIYKTSFAKRKWKLFQVLTFAFIIFLIGALFGILRMGGASLNVQWAAYSFFAEPVFTWFSTSTYLINNNVPLLNFPVNFLTSFLNLIPNSVISLKSFVVPASEMVKGYESPLGADSLWSNIVINFGIVGSFFFVFFTGFILNLLRHLSEKSRFAATYYIMVCGIIPFQLFRDGFFILNKQLFFNFLLFPGLILLVFKTLLFLQDRFSRGKDVLRVGHA